MGHFRNKSSIILSHCGFIRLNRVGTSCLGTKCPGEELSSYINRGTRVKGLIGIVPRRHLLIIRNQKFQAPRFLLGHAPELDPDLELQPRGPSWWPDQLSDPVPVLRH